MSKAHEFCLFYIFGFKISMKGIADMRILILGGVGYLGWPTAMHLTAYGHEVAVVDNYLRRRLCREENVEPLFEVPNLHERVKQWEFDSGHKIQVFIGDLTEWDFIEAVFNSFTPDGCNFDVTKQSWGYGQCNFCCEAVLSGGSYCKTRHHG